MNAKETIDFLANYNSWRRGDKTLEMPLPSEIGSAIDDAVNLLRKQIVLEKEIYRFKKDFEWIAIYSSVSKRLPKSLREKISILQQSLL